MSSIPEKNSDSTRDDLLLLGELGAAQGLDGSVRLTSYLGGLDETMRFLDSVEALWLQPKGSAEPVAYPLERARLHGKRIVLRLAGIDSRTDLDALGRPVKVYIEKDAASGALDADEFLAEDLIGCRMLDIARDRMEIGTVVDVLSGPQDLLVIQPTADWWQARGNEIPPDEGDQKGGPPRFKLPIIKSLVPEINTADRFITADVPPGLEAV